MFKKSLLLILFFPAAIAAQKFKKSDKAIIENLQGHIEFLAADKLEGRRAGTNGEMLAAEYIKSAFEKSGLQPMGDSGRFYQSFSIWDGKAYDKKSYLYINDEKLSTDDFFPEPYSPELSMEASPFVALKESGLPWVIDLKDDLMSAKKNPHFNLQSYLAEAAKNAAKKGATALFMYNSDSNVTDERYDGRQTSSVLPIPVIMVTKKAATKYFLDETASLAVKFNIGFSENIRVGHNVIGYINNGAPNTVVLGAHLDHLGFGEDGNALSQTAEKTVYNGADDNASGIAALIEISKLLKRSRPKNNNYLFIAFSGEELGLFGSKYFVDHATIDINSINYMVNMDMVGRLNDKTRVLTVGGYGTSPAWPQVIDKVAHNRYLVSKFDSSGAGPSDHTSFYRKNIPVLFFFTGVHADYHKPSDDFAKININGEYLIVQYIYKIIESANTKGKLAFTGTRNSQPGSTATFSVTLGIQPDYAFNGEGVRIDAVSDGRPAQKAALKPGDIIVMLGDFRVSSLEEYMQALSKFKKGDQTKVSVKREDKRLEADITF